MTNIGCLRRIYSDSILWFPSIFGEKWIKNLLRNIGVNVSLYITRCSNTESLYRKSACAELTGGFVSFYITRNSNTESQYGKSVCKELTWKICFLIYHAVIKHRAGTRDDISCWHWRLCWSENNHLWPSFYCLFIAFPFGDNSWSSGHLPRIYHLIIWSKKHMRVTWSEWVSWVLCEFLGLFLHSGERCFTWCSINRARECV